MQQNPLITNGKDLIDNSVHALNQLEQISESLRLLRQRCHGKLPDVVDVNALNTAFIRLRENLNIVEIAAKEALGELPAVSFKELKAPEKERNRMKSGTNLSDLFFRVYSKIWPCTTETPIWVGDFKDEAAAVTQETPASSLFRNHLLLHELVRDSDIAGKYFASELGIKLYSNYLEAIEKFRQT